MNRFLFSFLLLASFACNAQVMWQFNKDTVITWYYQDGDEFNDNELNREKWSTGLSWGRAVMAQDLYFTDGEDLEEKNGFLRLYLNKRDFRGKVFPWEIDTSYLRKNNIPLHGDSLDFKYTAGMIWSKQKFRYGYFEIRFKCSKNSDGMWPAFWTYGGYKNDEIDFFELKGEKYNSIHVDTHCPNGCDNYKTGMGLKKNWGGWIKTDKSLDDGYNTIAGEWGNGYVKWYLNGQGISYFKGNFDTAMHVLANMSIAKDGGPFSPGPTENTVYPGSMDIDYIRIWTKDSDKASNATLYAGNGNEQRGITEELKGNKTSLKRKKKFLYGNKKNYKNDGFFVSLIKDSETSYMLSQKGITDVKVDVEIRNSEGKTIFSKENFSEEFMPVNMAEWHKGKYILVIKSDFGNTEYTIIRK